MIGNEIDAYVASTMPDEYLFSNAGCSRLVYLINNVIYKVERNHRYAFNAWEYKNYRKLTGNLPEGVFLPEMSLYLVGDRKIIAAEYLTGELTGSCTDIELGLPCSHEQYGEVCLDPDFYIDGWGDTAWGNAMWVEGSLYLLDIA